MLIGLTGGIASGKTTVSNMLKSLGAPVIDADKIAHQIMKKGEKGWQRVVDYFGQDILDKQGEINRAKLGQIVFNDKNKRKKLEALTHPIIIKKIEEQIQELQKDNKHIILDIPLLYEVGMDQMVEQVWVVWISQEEQLHRLQQRDDMDKKSALKRINAQLSLTEKARRADIVINNMGTIEQLKKRIVELWRDIN